MVMVMVMIMIMIMIKIIMMIMIRRVATCKPGMPGLTSFSETLTLFFHFGKRRYRTNKMVPRAYQKNLAGYVPADNKK